jgi:hypothetical protein
MWSAPAIDRSMDHRAVFKVRPSMVNGEKYRSVSSSSIEPGRAGAVGEERESATSTERIDDARRWEEEDGDV